MWRKQMNNKYAVIFDMDGTMVNNSQYHEQAWREFIKKYGKNLSEKDMQHYVFGRTNKATLEYIFNRELTPEEIFKYGEEKEQIYRTIYRPYIKPVDGLIDFLNYLKQKNVTMAVATSADPPNVDFVLGALGIKDYFKTIVDASEITEGKPNPEIFLKTANRIGYSPERCIVFEDSSSGIKAGKSAGMKVVAITTTSDASKLKDADYVINDFTVCQELFSPKNH